MLQANKCNFNITHSALIFAAKAVFFTKKKCLLCRQLPCDGTVLPTNATTMRVGNIIIGLIRQKEQLRNLFRSVCDRQL